MSWLRCSGPTPAREDGSAADARGPSDGVRHYRRPPERAFTRRDRDGTTLLFGGLTHRHERLLQAVLARFGHASEVLPCPDVAAFQTGKEFGNPGQCNPTYFTVGSLLRYLQDREADGTPRDRLVDRYVLVTGGACGPCRFGMYEAEYRLALRNAGFDGFRVVLFDKDAGLDQSSDEAGLDLDADFFLGLLAGIVLGDLLNDLAFQVRPFEVEPGRTDAVLTECLEHVASVVEQAPPVPRSVAALRGLGTRWPRAGVAGPVVAALTDRRYVDALADVRDAMAAIEVDRTRLRPVVKVTGEFWAQTTEGDGNFRMFSFLEREGAQVVVEPVSTWVMYLLHQTKQRNSDRKGLDRGRPVRRRGDLLGRAGDELRLARSNTPLSVAEMLVRREWERHRAALGGLPHPLSDQYVLQRLAHPHYNSRAAGGEGHLEVAKNLYYSTTGRSHMVLSVKPFGCMPSTQSDAVQSALTTRYPDMVFLPVETSGDGEINAHSRVQMALADARTKAAAELERELDRAGLTLDEVRAYVAERPRMRSATYRVPPVDGVAGTAATLVRHVTTLRAGRS